MKKALSFILALTMIFSLAACGAKSDPSEVVKKYCEAMKQIDTATMSSCLVNAENEEADELEEDYGDFTGMIDYFKECAKQETYEIVDTNVADNKGTVTVKFNYVDATDLIVETFQAYLLNAFSLAFSNADEEEMQKAFFEAFDSKKEIIKTGTSEATVVFHCTKTDSGWLIDEAPEEIASILSCNADKAFEGFQNAFDGTEFTDNSSSNDVKVETWYDIHVGETAELATIKMTVTACEEKTELGNNWTSVQADPGTKFVVYTVSIENTTKQPFSFSADGMTFQDSQERQYNTYDKAMMYADETFFYTELAPNIKKTGNFIYMVPEDATGYYIMCGKSGTNEGYRFFGN